MSLWTSGSHRTRPAGFVELRAASASWLGHVLGQGVVRVGVVDAGGGDVEQLLPVRRDGVGKVDDVEDLGAAEAGDLHGSHAAEARCGRQGRAWTGR